MLVHGPKGVGSFAFFPDFSLRFYCCWWCCWHSILILFQYLHYFHSVDLAEAIITSEGIGSAIVRPTGLFKSIRKAVVQKQNQRRVLTLPRIPVKPDWNASVAIALPYRPRPPMGLCEYLKEVESESQKCRDGEKGPNRVGNFPSCQGHFVRCRPSRACASGTICHSRLSDAHCCPRHADVQCPSTDQLGYSCLQKNPVNWCNVNADCVTNALRSRICCPTGCGYNVCLSNVRQPTIGRIHQMARTRLLSPDCPNPFEIRIKCVVPRPASWCHSARECPTYARTYPRRCCLTTCGYNVCLTKFGDNGWIIA